MKNTVKIIGIVAFIALFAFSFITCKEDAGDPKDLKVKGLSKYEGKYITGVSDTGSIFACADWDLVGQKIKGAKVDGGTAELTAYKVSEAGKEVYKDSDTVTMEFFASDTEEVSYTGNWGTSIGSKSVTFKDGIAEPSF